MQTLSILIPVYNEQAYLRRLVERVLSAPLPEGLQKEIVLVNDASTDRTPQVISELVAKYPDIRAFEQPKNMGKGAAIRRAIQEMTGDYAIIQDADLEYDPNEYPIMLKPLLEGYADVVYGSRFTTKEMRKVLFYHHKLGNHFLTFLSNLTTGLDLTDMETCYKAFRGKVLKSIPLRSNRFGIEPEITAKIAKRGLNVYEVPISYHGRKYSEGKKIGWKDGFSALWTIFKYWLLDDYADDSDELWIKNSVDNVRNYNREVVARALPYLGTRILEVNAHVGLISRFLPQRELLAVSDSREKCVDFLKNLYDGNEMVEVLSFDPDDPQTVPDRRYDSVLFVHGLQQMADDKVALRNIGKLLDPGGKLILVIPNHPRLFSSFDVGLGYRRRYSRLGIDALLRETGYRVVGMKSLHSFSFFSALCRGVLLRRHSFGKFWLKFVNELLPYIRWIQAPGGNLFVVAEKMD